MKGLFDTCREQTRISRRRDAIRGANPTNIYAFLCQTRQARASPIAHTISVGGNFLNAWNPFIVVVVVVILFDKTLCLLLI